MAIMVNKAKKSQVRYEAYDYFLVKGDGEYGEFEQTFSRFPDAMAFYRKCEDGKLYGVLPNGKEDYLLAL